ncbi:MAG: SRPBCC domain-containing protein [Patescibacteria group bacterium]
MNEPKFVQQNHNIYINVSPKVLWERMLSKDSYKYWTQEFEPTSYYEGELELNNEIQFLGHGMSGMLAKVTKLEKYKNIGFCFVGSVIEGKIDKSSDNPFNQGIEEYYFEAKGEGTELRIVVDTTPEYNEFMESSWKKALLKLKELAESKEIPVYVTPLIVQTVVEASPSKVWDYFTTPKHIEKWSKANEDWGCRDSSVDLKVGGRFSSYIHALDESYGFEFSGVYTEVEPMILLKYTLDDNRKVIVNMGSFDEGKTTIIKQYFEPETENSLEDQQKGWQSFLDNFKKYIEQN